MRSVLTGGNLVPKHGHLTINAAFQQSTPPLMNHGPAEVLRCLGCKVATCWYFQVQPRTGDRERMIAMVSSEVLLFKCMKEHQGGNDGGIP